MLKNISDIIKKENLDIWYNQKLLDKNKCFYSSVDLRYSGNKLAPVDTNLFPAGFNNLTNDNIQKAIFITKDYLTSNFPNCKKISLIAEDHNRNSYYLKNIESLKNIIEQAGYIVELNADIKHYQPDLIILNNDLITGIPDFLQNVDIPIIPHPNNGWFKRRKSHHFDTYNKLAKELEDLFKLPSFFFTTEFATCKDVNFKTKQGLETLAEQVDQVINNIKDKYKQHNINETPYLIIKSDYGTYGMGVIKITKTEEIFTLNKKLRNEMHVTKNRVITNQVIIQEGIKTIDKVENKSAEPLIYLMNHIPVSFLYRSHEEKDEYSSLNSVGMRISNHVHDDDEYHQVCYFIARLATLAAAIEL